MTGDATSPAGVGHPVLVVRSADHSTDYGHFTNAGTSDLDFLASASNFQFDPQLFGGYREPQENILGSGIDDTFFNDAFEMDFTTPYFAPSPVAHKKEGDDLLARIDAAKNEDSTELVQTNDGHLLTCNKIWYDSIINENSEYSRLTSATGRNCKTARGYRAVISTSTACALIYRRKPSALGLGLLLMRAHSRTSCRSILARPAMRPLQRCPIAQATSRWLKKPRHNVLHRLVEMVACAQRSTMVLQFYRTAHSPSIQGQDKGSERAGS